MRRVLLFLVAGFLIHALLIIGDGLYPRTQPADVIVVLGNTVNPDGTLSPRLEARMEAALTLLQADAAPRVLVSGGTGVEGVNEATAMGEWLVAHGVPRAAILVDPAGDNTWSTAVHTRAILAERGLSTAIVVSSYFHVPRARMALRRAGVDVVGSAPATLIWEARELYSIPREVVALYAYALDGKVR